MANDRGLTAGDFGPGKITLFDPASLGPNWKRISAASAYRVQKFLDEATTKIYPGAKFAFTSTYRSPSVNASTPGASATSYHLPGKDGLSRAFDVWLYTPDFFDRSRLEALQALARKLELNGFGLYQYKQLVHVDTRPSWWTWGARDVKVGGKTVREFIPRDKILSTIGRVAGAGGSAAILAAALLLFLNSRKS